MTKPNIKEDVKFIVRVLNNRDNKVIHLKPLKNLIKNFQKKWNDLLGEGISDTYINFLNNKYEDAIQHIKRNDRPQDR